jgi:hypothetical protein
MPPAPRTPHDGQALTPALAVEYVRELSADVRAVVVLAEDGELLAGPDRLAGPARALLAAGGGAAELEASNGDGVVCAVRSAAHAAIAACGRFAIPGVVREDLRAALAALEGRSPAAGSPPPAAPGQAADASVTAAADALISASQRAFGT